MAALNFPTPTFVGQTYMFNTVTYTWDGTSWRASIGAAASGLMMIGKVVCVGGETTITFNNIPQTFSDLEIIFQGQDTISGVEQSARLQFNGDTTSTNYTVSQYIQGINGATAAANTVAAAATGGAFAGIPGVSGNANAFGIAHIRIPNYAGTTFYKASYSSYLDFYSATPALDTSNIAFIWKSTAAVTKIVLTAGGTAWAAGTTAVLYGRGGTAYSALSSADPSVAQGRLTLASGTPVTTTDVTGATTIYWTPYKGNRISLYDGAGTWTMYTFSELALALGTKTSGANYDVFAYANNGVVALELSAAWTSDTARADAISLQDGVYVKSGATTRKYLGTFRTTSTTTTEDSAGGTTSQVGGKRFVWNYYNRTRRHLAVFDSTASWAYTTATWRQANGAAGNKVEYVSGLNEEIVRATLLGNWQGNNNTARCATVAVALDSATAPSRFVPSGIDGASSPARISLIAPYSDFAGVGYHYLAWIEQGSDGTGTFYGSSLNGQSGMTAELAG